jgi:hypothetical protein
MVNDGSAGAEVGVHDGVASAVGVSVGPGVSLGVSEAVAVDVSGGVGVWVSVAVGVSVAEGTGVSVGVSVGVGAGGIVVGVSVGVGGIVVSVSVGVGVGVSSICRAGAESRLGNGAAAAEIGVARLWMRSDSATLARNPLQSFAAKRPRDDAIKLDIPYPRSGACLR